jgi:hypothetical protein
LDLKFFILFIILSLWKPPLKIDYFSFKSDLLHTIRIVTWQMEIVLHMVVAQKRRELQWNRRVNVINDECIVGPSRHDWKAAAAKVRCCVSPALNMILFFQPKNVSLLDRSYVLTSLLCSRDRSYQPSKIVEVSY